MVAYIIYSAGSKFCYMNTLFGLNKVFSLKQFYLTNLLKYNPEPVFLIDKDSLIVYRNKPISILFALQGVKKSSSIFVYGADITTVVQAEAEIINTQKEVVYAMGEIGETRSKEICNHVKRVAKYSRILAIKYDLREPEIEFLRWLPLCMILQKLEFLILI